MVSEGPADRASEFQASGCLEPAMGSNGERQQGSGARNSVEWRKVHPTSPGTLGRPESVRAAFLNIQSGQLDHNQDRDSHWAH